MDNNFVIVGGGISGMYAALLLRKKFPDATISLIEASDKLGGLLQSTFVDGYGFFDMGTHIPSETGREDIDNFFKSILNDHCWSFRKDSKKDLPGCFFNNAFYDGNQFLVLEDIGFKDDLVRKIENNSTLIKENLSYESLYEFYLARYGSTFVNEVIRPIVEKRFGTRIEQLSSSASDFLPLSRVISKSITSSRLIDNSDLRKVFAFPEIRETPEKFLSTTQTFYPKSRGIYQLVVALEELLKENQIRIYTSCQLNSLNISRNNVVSASFNFKGNQRSLMIENISKFFWAVSPISVGKFLNVNIDLYDLDEPLNTYIVNLIVANSNVELNNHYYYVLDKSFNTYRITNYKSFTSEIESSVAPFTLEFIFPNKISDNDLINIAQKEALELFKTKEHEVKIVESYKLNSGFPKLSLKNKKNIGEFLKDLIKVKPNNLEIFSLKGDNSIIFFYREILINTHEIIDLLH